MPDTRRYQERPSGLLGLEFVIEGCKVPYGYWDLNLSLLEEQPALLTTEPSLQSLCLCKLALLVPLTDLMN